MKKNLLLFINNLITEVLDDVRKRKGKCIIIKADFEKAYDYVYCEFLYYMLQRMSFCVKWVAWIKDCLESSTNYDHCALVLKNTLIDWGAMSFRTFVYL